MNIFCNYKFQTEFCVEDGKVYWCKDEIEKKHWYNIAQIHVSGHDQNDHHGGKHSGCSAMDTLQYAGHEWQDSTLHITLRDEQMQAVYHYQFYKDIAAVRSWVTVTALTEVDLEYVASLSLTGITGDTVIIPHNAWGEEGLWQRQSLTEAGLSRMNKFSSKRIAVSNTGTWSAKEYLPMGALEGEQTYLWQIENNGSWAWELSTLPVGLYLQLSGPTERENGWYKKLSAGESFESVPAVLTVAADFDGAVTELCAYRRTVSKKTEADRHLPVIFNDYMNCLFADPTTAKELPLIDKAASLGAEYYVMDAGWYADGHWWDTVGEWEPCTRRFPNGITEVFDRIREKGMIPGLWLEIEAMGVNCPILDRFDDSCFFMRHGKRVIDHGRYQLDFRSQKVRDFADSIIDRVVGQYGVRYIKMDYNIEAGTGTEQAADSFGDGLLEHNRAYLRWIDSLYERYPDLIIENCSSGGMRADHAMMAHHAILSATDQTDCLKMTHIAATAALSALPEQIAVWAYPKADNGENLVILNMINALPLRIHLSGQIMDLEPACEDRIRQAITLYKQIRHRIAQSVPFFPCGLPHYDDKIFCTAYKSDKTYLAVWRLDTAVEALEIPLCGTQAKILYGKGELEGDEDSLTVILPQENSAVFIEL